LNKITAVVPQEAKYVERWPNTTSAWAGWSRFDLPGLAGADLIFQWIGMVEYIPSYSAPAEHWGLLPATRLASRKILIEQYIKKRTGPALWLLCSCAYFLINIARHNT
jgi:hypothetical protein